MGFPPGELKGGWGTGLRHNLMNADSRIYIAGHRGMVGSAIHRELVRSGFRNLVTRTRKELDLTDARAVEAFYDAERPKYVFVAAARVGGIKANDALPADFLLQNLQIQTHLISGAHRSGVSKLLFLGSSCIYPKHAAQPIREDALLSAPLEPTNQWYAIAKIAGIKLCQALKRQHACDFISAVPTNLYGPNDNYDPEASHVIPSLIRRFHEARQQGLRTVTCWGTGSPLREFMNVEDAARAIVHLMLHYSGEEMLNVAGGEEITMQKLSELIARIVGYQGAIVWDTSRPDGMPRKLLDGSRLAASGFRPSIPLEDGLKSSYQDFLTRHTQPRRSEPAEA